MLKCTRVLYVSASRDRGRGNKMKSFPSESFSPGFPFQTFGNVECTRARPENNSPRITSERTTRNYFRQVLLLPGRSSSANSTQAKWTIPTWVLKATKQKCKVVRAFELPKISASNTGSKIGKGSERKDILYILPLDYTGSYWISLVLCDNFKRRELKIDKIILRFLPISPSTPKRQRWKIAPSPQ